MGKAKQKHRVRDSATGRYASKQKSLPKTSASGFNGTLNLEKSAPALRQALLSWYGEQGRDLPWRRSRDPYAIWISEIMLQQTQVKTVRPYYQRWLAMFPTVTELAQAEQQTVLKAWEGLGYYARARNLHKAAQLIVEQHNGVFPREFEDAIALPGIGRTTAGGILSAAYDLPVAILDGNVKRVLARLVALPQPPAKAINRLWQLSEQILDPQQPRDFNQAIMDLGATLCTRHQPSCLLCPWQPHCAAYHQNLQSELPMTESRAPLPHKQIGVAVIYDNDGRILIDRRKQEGLLGGLWEFPGGKIEPNEAVEDCVKREIKEELDIEIQVNDRLITVNHAYSHFKVTLNVFNCTHLSGEPKPIECDEIKWVTLDEIESYPFPKANGQIIDAIKEQAMQNS
ncbi:a g-specific dna-adenine glycosylase [Leptolyngbya sp. Heron Island J]|uniref:A/G-specific adenine glycosylase n=1 Tax=Leptolyngbya sp. Heron Island J TaxID=1385935 RepID=UPI0003B9DB11|nr:A/G-specific adenine glycosylase [Leptolyngbya sp. Heron Island J]ESA39076.1 a g-specific dna-adenine glycosylase [Leptolyngbya sp. Heron Island J]